MGQKKHKYKVQLAAAERSNLENLIKQRSIEVRQLKRAQVLLLADETPTSGGQTDKAIAGELGLSPATIVRTRQRYVEAGLAAALADQPRSGRPPTFSGEARAKVTALACADAPLGYQRWSLRLLADKVVELDLVERISYKTVGEILKKTNSSPT